jgi:DNA-binding transcriptional regulator YhcF (GntR family)
MRRLFKRKKTKKFRASSEGVRNELLRVIYSSGDRWLSTNEVAKKAKTNWITATKYLNELFAEGYLKRGKTEGGLTCWKESTQTNKEDY